MDIWASISRSNKDGEDMFAGLQEPTSPSRPELLTDLPWPRRKLASILRSPYVEGSIYVLILLNLVVVIGETNAVASQVHPPDWMAHANTIILGVFFFELGCRVWVFRRKFFRGWWNIMDLTIVFIDVALLLRDTVLSGVPSLLGLRMLRLVRMVRGAKIIAKFPQLVLLVQGCAAALGAIMWGLLLLGFLALMWSILAVNVIHPLAQEVADAGGFESCARCPYAYSSVQNSMLTLFQGVIAGDSWGASTIPIIEAYPSAWAFFFPSFVSMNIALLNVILAVIVNSALKAGEENEATLKREKELQMRFVAQQLRGHFQEMDTNADGQISREEFANGYDQDQDLRLLLSMIGVTQYDLQILFHIMDIDDSNSVNFNEFVTQLRKMKSRDPETMLSYIRFSASKLNQNLHEQMRLLEEHLITSFKEIVFESALDFSSESQALASERGAMESRACDQDHKTWSCPGRTSPVGKSMDGVGNMEADRPRYRSPTHAGIRKVMGNGAAMVPMSLPKLSAPPDATSESAGVADGGGPRVGGLRAGRVDGLDMFSRQIGELRDALHADISRSIQDFFAKFHDPLLMEVAVSTEGCIDL